MNCKEQVIDALELALVRMEDLALAKQEINDAAPDLGASCFADLLNAALGEVDWYEIAEHMIADAKENVSV